MKPAKYHVHHHHHHQYLAVNGISGKPKFTTRPLAALDFLLNISMKNEFDIRETGMLRLQSLENANIADSLVDPMSTSYSNFHDDDMGNSTDAAGRKLHGILAPTLKIPANFRYQMQKLSEQSAAIRHWEDQIIARGHASLDLGMRSQPLLNSRLLFSRQRSYPLMVFSVIKYDAGEEKAKLEKLRAGDRQGLEVYEIVQRDWRGSSYQEFFKSTTSDDISSSDHYYNLDKGFMYDPDAIDDSTLLHGSHRHVLQRAAVTGPILSSLILYVNETQLKQSLNEQFREYHPLLPPSLTLSKIRNLKKRAVLTGLKLLLDVSTVALAVICFERLCMKGIVTKGNRNLTMAVSLLLAYKMNERVTVHASAAINQAQSNYSSSTSAAPVKTEYYTRLEAMLDVLDKEWEVSRRDIFDAEFGAFVLLGFSLHVPQAHLHLVYTRLLKLVNKTSRAYLGEEMNDMYAQDLIQLDIMRDVWLRESRQAQEDQEHANEEIQQQQLQQLQQAAQEQSQSQQATDDQDSEPLGVTTPRSATAAKAKRSAQNKDTPGFSTATPIVSTTDDSETPADCAIDSPFYTTDDTGQTILSQSIISPKRSSFTEFTKNIQKSFRNIPARFAVPSSSSSSSTHTATAASISTSLSSSALKLPPSERGSLEAIEHFEPVDQPQLTSHHQENT